jgi:hypothetical protein
MAIDKSVYQAPQGLAATPEAEPIEIEIVDPEAVRISAGDMSIDIEPEGESDFSKNLAEDMDEQDLMTLGSDLIGLFESDVNGRKDWADTYVQGLKLLGLKYEETTEPWAGACGVFHPMLSEAVVRFQSEAIMETFPSSGPVKTQILGKETTSKKEASVRVSEDMNNKLMNEMTEYRPEHEKLLWNLPLAGSAFKKVYYDPSLERQVAMFIPAEDFVVPYGASNLDTAERMTHVMRKTKNDVKKLMVAGFYRDVDLGEPMAVLDDIEKRKAEEQGFSATNDNRYRILEIHVDYDLPGYEDEKDGEPTGVALPYVITIEKSTGKVLAIRRNWLEDDTLKSKRIHFVHYQYVPGFGFYGYGLIHLIGGYARSATTMLRQLIDAGTLSNLPGGLKSRGLRVKGDDTPISPGEFRDVDVPSGTIKDNVMLLPYKEPSQTLSQLFNQIVTEGRNFVSAGDLQVSDMGGNAPVGTTLAILERTLKVMSAIQARLHYSMKQEFKLLKHIIADYTPEEYDYEPEEGQASAKKADYDDVEVIPVSDPNASTMAQKIVQWQAVMQLAQQAPQLYNLPFLHRQMVETLGIKNAAKLIPMSDDQKPADPVTENQNILMMKPVKAFSYQDHKSHIAVHQAAMQDPMIIGLLQNNPQAPQLQASMMAHINEHAGFLYRSEIEKQMGMALPKQHMNDMNEEEDENMSPEVEYEMSQRLAQAAQQLLQQNKQQAQQQQAQQQAQDPIIQMQMQELQLKQQEQQRKAAKDQTDAQLKMQQLQLEAQRIQSQAKTAALQTTMNSAVQAEKLKHQQRVDGGKLALDAVNKDRQYKHEVGIKAVEGKNKQALAMQQHLQNKDSTEQQHRQSMEQQKTAAQNAPKETKKEAK